MLWTFKCYIVFYLWSVVMFSLATEKIKKEGYGEKHFVTHGRVTQLIFDHSKRSLIINLLKPAEEGKSVT